MDIAEGRWTGLDPNVRPADPVAEGAALAAFGLHGDQVTTWRRAAQAKAQEIVALITAHADPETRYAIARALAEDIQHEIKTALRRDHGRVFDTLLDGSPLDGHPIAGAG